MAGESKGRQVPKGTAIFPMIPEELGVNPLLLAVLHAIVFVDGSTANLVNPDAADVAMQYVATYLHRLSGPQLRQVREDVEALLGFARQEKWPKAEVDFLKGFLADYEVGAGS